MEIEVENNHLFRYGTEIDPKNKKSKGGYLKGYVRLSPELSDQDVKLKLTTIAGAEMCSLEEFHPSALFVARKKGSQRDYDKEARPNVNMFQQELHIVDRQCFIVNKYSALDQERNVPLKDKLFPLRNNTIQFGDKMEELNLIILKCHVDSRSKSKADSITLGDFINTRLSDQSSETRGVITKEFTGSKANNKYKMRIKVEAFSLQSDELLASVVSENIVDADKWAFKLSYVVPRKSCSNGGSRVVLVSEYSLGDGKVTPKFQLWKDGERAEEFEEPLHLNQPKADQIKRIQNTIIFTTPPQPNLNIIEDNDLEIKIVLFKEREFIESNAMDFTYVSHDHFVSVDLRKELVCEGYPCSYCKDNPCSNNSLGDTERAKPHKRKKVLTANQIENIKRHSVSIATEDSPRSLTSDSGIDLSPVPDDLIEQTNSRRRKLTVPLPDDLSDLSEQNYSRIRTLTNDVDWSQYGIATADGPGYDIATDSGRHGLLATVSNEGVNSNRQGAIHYHSLLADVSYEGVRARVGAYFRAHFIYILIVAVGKELCGITGTIPTSLFFAVMIFMFDICNYIFRSR